jgi:hypothetical protein
LALLQCLEFQPRLGLVTRTIALAWTDLSHFLLLFGVVLCGYATVGFLVFGSSVSSFSSWGDSLSNLMLTFMGDTAVSTGLLPPHPSHSPLPLTTLLLLVKPHIPLMLLT